VPPNLLQAKNWVTSCPNFCLILMCFLLEVNTNCGSTITILCLSVDTVTKGTITKMATRYLRKWLTLPRSATHAILYYLGVYCPSISQISRQEKYKSIVMYQCLFRLSTLRLHITQYSVFHIFELVGHQRHEPTVYPSWAISE